MLRTIAIASSIGIAVALALIALLSSGIAFGISETELRVVNIVCVSIWPGVTLIPGIIGNPSRAGIYLIYAGAVLTNVPLYASVGVLIRFLYGRGLSSSRREPGRTHR
jgi:hypothetical protein